MPATFAQRCGGTGTDPGTPDDRSRHNAVASAPFEITRVNATAVEGPRNRLSPLKVDRVVAHTELGADADPVMLHIYPALAQKERKRRFCLSFRITLDPGSEGQ